MNTRPPLFGLAEAATQFQRLYGTWILAAGGFDELFVRGVTSTVYAPVGQLVMRLREVAMRATEQQHQTLVTISISGVIKSHYIYDTDPKRSCRVTIACIGVSGYVMVF